MGDASLPPAFEAGSTVREVIWGVDESADILRIRAALTAYGAVTECEDGIFSADPSGLAVGFRVTCAWETQLGPGRHPIASAYFWYFKNPAGGLIEYYSDEDVLTEPWVPRDFEPGPTMCAEWAIAGGIDGFSRRQKG